MVGTDGSITIIDWGRGSTEFDYTEWKEGVKKAGRKKTRRRRRRRRRTYRGGLINNITHFHTLAVKRRKNTL